MGGVIFFSAQNGTTGELWKSDGTEAGTVLVKSIAIQDTTTLSKLVNVNGTLFFAVDTYRSFFIPTACINCGRAMAPRPAQCASRIWGWSGARWK